MSNLTVRILHSLIIFVLLGAFAYNVFSNVRSFQTTTRTFNVTKVDQLVPPALTFCITKDVAYDFTIQVYNQTVERTEYLELVPANSAQLDSLRGQVVRCWILSAGKNALIKNPPPVANVPDLVFTTKRTIVGDGSDPLLVNIFDPLQRESLFDFNRFLLLDPDINRAVQFSRTKSIDIRGKEINDVKYNIIDEFRDPGQTIPGVSSSNKFTFRPVSFDVEVSQEVRSPSLPVVIFNCLTFLGVLVGSIYIPLVGQGKYRPWGYIHRLIGYYPIEHMNRPKRDEENGWSKRNDNSGFHGELPPNMGGQNDSPRIEEKLRVYLDKIGNAKYSNY